MRVARTEVVNEREIASAVRKAANSLAPDVVRIRYTLKEDSTGVPAIFFRVLLTDEASKEPQLYETAQRIESKILKIVKPDEKFGLEAYFNFRSAAEQAELREAAWE